MNNALTLFSTASAGPTRFPIAVTEFQCWRKMAHRIEYFAFHIRFGLVFVSFLFREFLI